MRQITIAEAIQRTVEHREIFHDEMLDLMRQIMSGQMSPVMIAVSPFDSITTETWPGVCPVVGINRTSGEMR